METNEPIRKPIRLGEQESQDPIHTVRKGAIAANIWQRQSPSGYAYFDFSLSRSWKSLSTDKKGYSRNFFETSEEDLIEVIRQASAWITRRKEELATTMPATLGRTDRYSMRIFFGRFAISIEPNRLSGCPWR
jgi:hypothetical protein